MSKVSRVEVIQTGARRRWTLEEKRRIVAESATAPRQVSATARRHGLSPSHLFAWRRLAREGCLGTADQSVRFAQAVVACDPALISQPSIPEGLPAAAGRMEIVLGDGIRVIVGMGVDAGALARMISAIERR